MPINRLGLRTLYVPTLFCQLSYLNGLIFNKTKDFLVLARQNIVLGFEWTTIGSYAALISKTSTIYCR